MERNEIQPFKKSKDEYEHWLSGQLDEVWKKDLDEKHEKMRESAFVFLRATYWRWAETILAICEDLAHAPMVIGIGDIHLENYGVWRDREGRLVWGINDLDEAADMPYAVDVVRLTASALLSRPAKRRARKEICAEILAGYRGGLAAPRPFTIDEDHMWLRRLFAVSERERRRFWKKMDRLRKDSRIPDRYRKPLEGRVPRRVLTYEKFARRAAGTGSLGRPRWVGLGNWRGGRFVREAKAIAVGLVSRAPATASARTAARCSRPAGSAPPIPGIRCITVVVRRLSPNARKIEVRIIPTTWPIPRCSEPWGTSSPTSISVSADVSKAIRSDLDHRGNRWLLRSAETAAEFVSADFKEERMRWVACEPGRLVNCGDRLGERARRRSFAVTARSQ